MGEKLKNPPLIEAVCEFRFSGSSPWDWTIPGQLYDRIKVEFPIRSEQGFTQPSPADSSEGSTVQLTLTPQLVRLSREDGSALVQVGQRLLSVNHLKPYPTWESFKSLIMGIYRQYSEIAGELNVERLGLRFINRIDVPMENFQIENYLNMGCSNEWLTGYPFASFYQRYEVIMSSPDVRLVHQTALITHDGKRVIILDLDLGKANVGKFEEDGILAALLDEAHDKVYEAFRNSVNHDLLERMKRGE